MKLLFQGRARGHATFFFQGRVRGHATFVSGQSQRALNFCFRAGPEGTLKSDLI